MEYTFRLTGRFKPFVRMTQRSKYVDMQAKAYLASKDRLGWELLKQMAAQGWEMIPRGVPLAVVIVIQPARHTCDLDNQCKGLLDAAQGIVFEDDRWVDTIVASRQNGEDDMVDFRVFCSSKQGGRVALKSGPKSDRGISL